MAPPTPSLPVDHIAKIRSSPDRPAIPSKATYGLDSLRGLLYSSFTAPLYLHASLRGKHLLWDKLLSETPQALYSRPTLDVGCGRGLVLLKIANLKRIAAAAAAGAGPAVHSAGPSMTMSVPETISPAYGIDIFNSADQTGNSPSATYINAAVLGLLDWTVLHTADFTAKLPYPDGFFSLVTASLSLHNVGKEGRVHGVREIARVCATGGQVIIVELYGYCREYARVLQDAGWNQVTIEMAGWQMMFGIWPCQILRATKPQERS